MCARRLLLAFLELFVMLPSVLTAAPAAPLPEIITPLLLAVRNAPIPFLGSDLRVHLVYELWLTNFSSQEIVLKTVEVIDDHEVLTTMEHAAVASRLQPVGRRDASATMAPSEQALLFIHVALPVDGPIPERLRHRVGAHVSAAPLGLQDLRESGGETPVGRSDVIVIAPPLRGARFISADSCCDASRHTRAALPVNGGVFLAQRFAVDWEALDDRGRIFAGPRSEPASYKIYGREVLAVADARVVLVRDELPDQQPGRMPSGIAVGETDGNSIVLDLGGGRYGFMPISRPAASG
jgi:hypothetical protein